MDSLTDIAARYLYTLCQSAASHSIHNHGDAGDYTVVDVRMALRDAGALQPEKTATEQEWLGEEDVRGVEEFIEWFSGQRMRELMEMGVGDGDIDATDYLNGISIRAPSPLSHILPFANHIPRQLSKRSTPKQLKKVNIPGP